MIERDQVLQFLERAKARVESDDPGSDPAIDTVRYARDRLVEAAPHAHVGTDLPPETRLRPVKSALMAVVRPVTSHQQPFNLQLLAALDGLTAAVEDLAHRVARADEHVDQLDAQTRAAEGHVARMQATVATTGATVDRVTEDLRRLTLTHSETVAAITRMAGAHEQERDESREVAERELRVTRSELDTVRSELASVRAKQSMVLRTARDALAAGGIDTGQLTELSRELATGYEELYEDLEDTFRGSRDEVKDKLAPYLDDVNEVPGHGPAIDVGCGRGEWLELLRDADIDGYGVDLNQVVVDRCVDRGLDVRAADALAHLRDLPDGSARVITSFHVVEHLSLDTLVGLIDAALVALQRDGLLIFETPNPTNLTVGAASFYLDPTHLKPLHPQFLEFLLQARGFTDTEVRYLAPSEAPRLTVQDLAATDDDDRERVQRVVDQVNWSLSGPMDYAVLARKAPVPAPAER